MVKEVLIIFKTHLDIGFTDRADKVTEQYMTGYMPAAIDLGERMRGTDTPFIWTVGSWLVWQALRRDTDGRVERAIRDGVLAWHALPCTTYTETMSPDLFEYALSLSQRLDERFGKKTIACKMSDVPGHTRAMVPFLARHGVELLHVGVNGATPLPDVPPVFRWKDGEDEVTVMYCQHYGNTVEFGDFVIHFGMTGDNLGPQDPEMIRAQYEELRKRYPGAYVHAATLSDAAIRLRGVRGRLPVVTGEIGDTWIHGAGTDPKKLSLYREVLRHIEKNGIGDKDLSDSLLMVPEHTWGADRKLFFDDRVNYLPGDFPEKADQSAIRAIEDTWQEQRDYVEKAQRILGTDFTCAPERPRVAGMEEIPVCDAGFEVAWQLFDKRDYERYFNVYIRQEVKNDWWVVGDYDKQGLPDYEGGMFPAVPVKAWRSGEKTVYQLDFDAGVREKYPLPELYAIEENGMIELRWFGQKPIRLPNAWWFRVKGMEEGDWEINKLGEWIRADDVIGSPLIAGFDRGVRNGAYMIVSLDACLAAPYGRRLLDFEKKPQKQEMWFDLYNNIWNTNHALWYAEDSRFRFIVSKR